MEKVNGVNINNIRFADDTAVMADSMWIQEGLQRLLDILYTTPQPLNVLKNINILDAG